MERGAKIILGLLSALLFFNAIIWQAVLSKRDAGTLTVSFLDVGQGDAILIQSTTGSQMLIDGGPDRSVLRELGRVMPWWDRTIDVVVATHPDADHVSGLVDVLQRYRVSYILEPGVRGDTPQAESMLKAVAHEDAVYMHARRGQVIDFGDGARLEILFPDRDVGNLETNTASIVARLIYGETSFMLTGDSPDSIEKYMVQLGGAELKSNVLKAGHHGSKTSSSLLFVGFVSPEYGVFSRGCDNTYGHPHHDVVDVFERFKTKTLDTCIDGRVTFVSDGQSVTLE